MPRHIASLFRIPTLKTLLADGLDQPGPYVPYPEPWDAPERVSNITTLRLTHCDISSPTMDAVLTSCKGLETFHWTVSCSGSHRHHEDRWHEWTGDEPDRGMCMHGLLAFAPTLTWLGIYTECSCSCPSSDTVCFGDFTADWEVLSKLSNLETLVLDQHSRAIDQAPLDCHRNLPANLKEIHYTLDASSSDTPAHEIVESVIDAYLPIPKVELRIELTLVPIIRDRFQAWQARNSSLFLNLQLRLPDDSSTPATLVVKRPKVASKTKSEAHRSYLELTQTAHAPYLKGEQRARPYRCMTDRYGICDCWQWPRVLGLLEEIDEESSSSSHHSEHEGWSDDDLYDMAEALSGDDFSDGDASSDHDFAAMIEEGTNDVQNRPEPPPDSEE